MMALLRLKDGSVPPFGAEVFNANGVSVAMVMENGMARIAGVNPAERLPLPGWPCAVPLTGATTNQPGR